MLLGSHLSISGGLHKALIAAQQYGFQALALFLRNQVQWRAKALDDSAVEEFRRTRESTDIRAIVAHASYLVNLAGKSEVRDKSIGAMIEDFTRCQRLGVEYLVFHPGSNPDLETGEKLIIDALNEIASSVAPEPEAPSSARVLLETTAGQGNCIGYRFEHLATILDGLQQPERFGVCLDTCHIFAAGYDLRTPETYADTMRAFDDIIGMDKLLAIHLNDSKRDFETRVDRHEHIGEGFLGRDAFVNIVNDSRLADIPAILETPKGLDEKGRDWDRINAETIAAMVSGS
ncbi:MAG: deoxyribonuclease IV [Phycisphaerae bacterium]|jgi:deoxyribonuclease-4|nr:deoxyribonuclease IV [Phycisphaerae bacterium]